MKGKSLISAGVLALLSPYPSAFSQVCDDDGDYLGQLSANPFLTDSTSNKFGPFGSRYASESIDNPYGPYGSPASVANPYSTEAPKIIAADGQYLGRLSANPYDPDSVSNPYGSYGSPYSSTSINNPYSQYGSQFSPISPNNPSATKPPVLCGDEE
jgi:hypothetical protein